MRCCTRVDVAIGTSVNEELTPMRHIQLSRLFAYAEGQTELHQTEQEHIATCFDCRQILKVFKTYLIDSGECEKHSDRAA